MSFIGKLEQFSLSTILQKIEGEAKNGVLIIKQEAQWVELSFRQGQLMCIGPVRSHKTLGDRLLQAGVITQKALQEIASALGASLQNETLTVIALVDRGYLNQDSLYVWAAQEATKILQVLLSWTTGEIYFDEDVQPPPDRLLIALTVSSLVPLQTLATPSQFSPAGAFSSVLPQKQSKFRAVAFHIPDALTLHEPSQFYSGSNTPSTSNSMNFGEGYATNVVRNTDALHYPTASMSMSKPLTEPLTQKRIDTACMQPQMVLDPTDLYGLRDRNLHVHITPEQWRLFTVADGKTTLQMACQQLVMSREQVCQVAGELVALRLITLSLSDSGLVHDSNPFPQDLANAGINNSYIAQTQSMSDSFASTPGETHSQWGNGGTGATFVLGNGWVVASSPSQPPQSNELYRGSGLEYAEASGIR